MTKPFSVPISILGHLDTFFALENQNRSFITPGVNGHCDYDRMLKANAQFGVFAIFPAKSQYNIIQGLDKWFNYLDEYKKHLFQVRTIKDFDIVKGTKKIGAILHIEGAGGFDSEFQLLHLAYRLGLRSLGITHANVNRFGTGYLFWGKQFDRGLSSEGKALVAEAQRLGISIDVSHLNDKSFWDVMDITKHPLLATHSNARALCKSGRNLTDEQIKAMGENHGVIGLNFGTWFLDPNQNRNNSDLSMMALKNHLDHIVQITDINTVAIGTDYDGTGVPTCVNSCEKLLDFYHFLLENGYSSQDLQKIAYSNFYRVFKDTWK